MDIELLRTFLAVIQTRHFGRAATQLFLTPAAVSARIRQLEQILGVKLLHRTRGNIQMTADGERLLPHAKKLMTTWLEVQEDLALTRLSAPLLKFGAPPGVWTLLFSSLSVLANTRAVRLSLLAGGVTDLHQLLLQQRLDLALLPEGFEHPDITSVSLGQSLTLALFATKQLEPATGLAAATYIHIDWGAGVGLQRQVSGADFSKVVYCNDLELVRQWLRQDRAYAYLPLHLPITDSENLVRVADDPGLELPLHLAYRAEIARYQPVYEFVKHITQPQKTK